MLLGVDRYGDDDPVKKLAGPADDVQVAQGNGVEAARADSSAGDGHASFRGFSFFNGQRGSRYAPWGRQ